MEPITLLIVCPLIFLSGVVDSIAGGGGLISLTAYLLAGLPAHLAIGTNKLSAAIGTAVATGRMAVAGFIKLRLALPAVVGALVGSYIGAQLALLTPEGIFQIVMIVALPVTAFFVLRKRSLDDEAHAAVDISPQKQLAIVALCSFGIGLYDGFYGPGTGTFMLIAFTAAAKLSVREASGEVKAANLASNISALVAFILAGEVWWTLGLIASVFAMAGNFIGAGLVLKDGGKIVRPIIIVVLCLLFVKVICDLVL